MKVLEETDRRLVVEGWSVRGVMTATILIIVSVGLAVWMIADKAWNMIFVALFCWAIFIRILMKIDVRSRIVLDRDAKQITLDQQKLHRNNRRTAPFAPDARVEIDRSRAGADGGQVPKRMVLVDAERRTPLSDLWYTHSFDDQAAMLNDWLERTR